MLTLSIRFGSDSPSRRFAGPSPAHWSLSLVAVLRHYARRMLIETVTASREEWGRWRDRIDIINDPPDGLVALLAWESGEGQVTQANVWDNPAAVADFFLKHVLPIIEDEGEPAGKPQRHGEPLAFFLRR